MVKFDIDTTQFNRAIASIAKYSGADLITVVEHEAGKVLEKAAGLTKTASAKNIRERIAAREFTRADAGSGRKLYYLKNLYPDPVWNKLQASLRASAKRKLAARGLSKQSWAQLAAAAGLRITVPAFVQKAIATTGKQYPDNVSASRVHRGKKFGITFENAQPTVQTFFVGGRRALQRAINGRAKFFATNMKKGVFTSLRKIAAAYPGLRITA